MKEQIRLLGPDELLREPLLSFEHLKETLLTQDPLAAVTTILTNLRDLIARILRRLSFETGRPTRRWRSSITSSPS